MDSVRRVKFHPGARAEADASFDYYRERSIGAAEAFFAELTRGLDQIEVAAERWPEYLYGTRCYLLRRFPFVIVYRPTAEQIEIVAVAHASRRPGYWASRLH